MAQPLPPLHPLFHWPATALYWGVVILDVVCKLRTETRASLALEGRVQCAVTVLLSNETIFGAGMVGVQLMLLTGASQFPEGASMLTVCLVLGMWYEHPQTPGPPAAPVDAAGATCGTALYQKERLAQKVFKVGCSLLLLTLGRAYLTRSMPTASVGNAANALQVCSCMLLTRGRVLGRGVMGP